jgi:hypothetical protein
MFEILVRTELTACPSRITVDTITSAPYPTMFTSLLHHLTFMLASTPTFAATFIFSGRMMSPNIVHAVTPFTSLCICTSQTSGPTYDFRTAAHMPHTN